MLEFSSCKRGNDLKNTSIELEELNVLIADTEDVKNDNSTERKYLYAIETASCLINKNKRYIKVEVQISIMYVS